MESSKEPRSMTGGRQGSREDARTRRQEGTRDLEAPSERHPERVARDLGTLLVNFPPSGLQCPDVASKESLITPHVREIGVCWRRFLSASRITPL